MTDLFLPDGKPDFAAIEAAFPLHDNGVITHRTPKGHDFHFKMERDTNGVYDVIILAQPSYGHRASNCHASHRLPHPSGLYKVCFQKLAYDLPTAVAVALWWAECTSKYIDNGGDWK